MTRHAAAALMTLFTTAGCAAVPQRSEWVEMRPLQVGAERQVSPADGYYSGAVAAINRRDYAAALELLQLARGRAPGDVRIFNAFGVVYDKLGRFDLSARYYALAAALEPSSPIVAANVAYSAVLAQRIAQPEAVRLAQADHDLKRMGQPEFGADPGPAAPRFVEGPPAVTLAVAGPPIRIQGVRSPVASASPHPMSQPTLAPPAPLTLGAAEPPAVVAAPGPPVRVQAARMRVAASPTPMTQPAFAAAPEWPEAAAPALRLSPMTASTPAPAAAARHALHPVVGAAQTPRTASAAVRIDAAERATSAPLRIMGQPTFAAASEPLPSAGPPIRLSLGSAPPAASPAQPARISPVIRLASAPPTAPDILKLTAAPPALRRLPLLAGRTLVVIDATGRPAGGGPVLTRLAHLGWSVPRSARPGPAQAKTHLVYPASNAAVAQALARTLPYRVRLVNCGGLCSRMRLVLGADVLGWRKGVRAGSIVRARNT